MTAPDSDACGDHRRCVAWRPARTCDVTAAHAARVWARRTVPILVPTAATSRLLDVVALLITELIANAILHGGGLRELHITVDGDWLRVAVSDSVPVLAARPVVSDPTSAGGRGLQLVQALSMCWGVCPGRTGAGKSVWADLALPLVG